MKKLIVLALLLITATYLNADEKVEQEFMSRFQSFISAGDISNEKLSEVWMYGDIPRKAFLKSKETFASTISREIESIEFVNIYPMMKEGINKPFMEEGKQFIVNVDPYKMLEVRYKKQIKDGSNGWSYLVGLSDGKLYFAGYKEIKKTD